MLYFGLLLGRRGRALTAECCLWKHAKSTSNCPNLVYREYPLPPSLPQSLLKASSPGAEALNGRLAMLGFVGIVATELATGRSLPAQLATTSGAGHAAALGLAVMAASLAPLLSGRVRPEQAFPSEVRRDLPVPGCSLAWLLGIACWVLCGAAAPCGWCHLSALVW